MALVLFVAGGLALIALSDRWWTRGLARTPHDLSGWRGGVFGLATVFGTFGVGLVVGWSLVRVPHPTARSLDQEPAPAALWQIGAGLAAAATVTWLVLFATAPRRHPQHIWSDRRAVAWIVVAAVALDVALVVATIAGSAVRSELATDPLVFAAIITVAAPIAAWWSARGQ